MPLVATLFVLFLPLLVWMQNTELHLLISRSSAPRLAPDDTFLLEFMLCVIRSHSKQGRPVQPIGNCKNECVISEGGSYKTLRLPLCSRSGGSSHHAVRTFKQSVERSMRRELRPPTKGQQQLASHVNEPLWKQTLQPRSSLRVSAAPSPTP